MSAQWVQNIMQKLVQIQGQMIKPALMLYTFVLLILYIVELELMDQELVSQDNAKLVKIKVLFIISMFHVIKHPLFAAKKKLV